MGQTELGKRVKRARQDARLTQPELAQRIGLKHPQSISRYERGLTEIPPAKLRRIAEATGKPMTFFVEEQAKGDEASLPPDYLARLDRRLEAMEADLSQIQETLVAVLQRRARERRHDADEPPQAASR